MPRTSLPLLIALAAATLPTASLSAQNAEDPVHDELRTFRARLVEAVLQDDVATQVELSHPDIVTMWQDGRIVTGREGLQAFLDELGAGADRGFLGYLEEPTPAGLTAVYDDRFGFAHGTSIAQYELYGMRFDLTNYWTATLLKEDGQWRLAGYHVSGNIADNPFLDAVRKTGYVIGGAAALVGLLLGFWIGRRSAAKPAASPEA